MIQDMNGLETVDVLIDRYADIQRALHADDIKAELEYQLLIIKAKLEACGVVVEKLDNIK